jgi:hypothetical protein
VVPVQQQITLVALVAPVAVLVKIMQRAEALHLVKVLQAVDITVAAADRVRLEPMDMVKE